MRHALLVTEAQSLDNALDNVFTETQQILTYVGNQISVYSANDPEAIQRTLRSATELAATTKATYSWTLLDWVDPRSPTALMNSQFGIIHNPYATYYDTYINQCRKVPWTLCLFPPHVGNTSGMWVINAALGVANKKAQYLGTLFIGLNVAALNAKMEKILRPAVNFIVLDQDLKIILQSAHNAINPKSSHYRDHYRELLSRDIFFKQSEGQLPHPITYKNITYTFYKKTTNYPYILLVGFDNAYIDEEIWNLFLPRFLELCAVGCFCLALLLLRRRLFNMMKASDRERGLFRHRNELEMNRSILAIFNYANLLRMHFKGEVSFSKERQKEIVANIYNTTCELHAIETNKLNLKYININGIIESAITIHAPTLIHGDIHVNTDLSPTLLPFYGDEFRLKQALVALIALSMNHSPRGSTLTITTRNQLQQNQQQLLVVFEDDGFFLNREDMTRLADIFVSESLSGEHPSHDQLTFSEIENLIHLHQGTCHMEENRDRGKKIIITLACRTKEDWEGDASSLTSSSNVHWLFQGHPTTLQ